MTNLLLCAWGEYPFRASAADALAPWYLFMQNPGRADTSADFHFLAAALRTDTYKWWTFFSRACDTLGRDTRILPRPLPPRQPLHSLQEGRIDKTPR